LIVEPKANVRSYMAQIPRGRGYARSVKLPIFFTIISKACHNALPDKSAKSHQRFKSSPIRKIEY
jgi:hypothetical protein